MDLLTIIKDYINEKRKIFEKTDDVFAGELQRGKNLYPKYAYNLVKNILTGK